MQRKAYPVIKRTLISFLSKSPFLRKVVQVLKNEILNYRHFYVSYEKEEWKQSYSIIFYMIDLPPVADKR